MGDWGGLGFDPRAAMAMGMQAASMSTGEEEALFEEWLADGRGRLREVQPLGHSSFRFANGVVLNIGSHGLIDDTHAAEGDVPYHVAPPRAGEGADERGTTYIDAVLHPMSLEPAGGSASFLKAMVGDIAGAAAGLYPEVLPRACAAAVPARIDPRPVGKVMLEISDAQIARGRRVLERAKEKSQRHGKVAAAPAAGGVQRFAPRPGTLLSMLPPQPIPEAQCTTVQVAPGPVRAGDVDLVYLAPPPSAATPASLCVEVYHKDALVEALTLPGCPAHKHCRAFLTPKTGRLRLVVYGDTTDARAAALRLRLHAARKRRARQRALTAGPGEGAE